MVAMPGAVFAGRLRHERRAQGMSQADFAERLADLLGSAVDPSAITRIEKGDRAVRLDEAVFSAEILGMPLASMVTDEGATAFRLTELRRDLERERLRMMSAEAEYQQSELAVRDIRRMIGELEASQDA